MSTLLAADDGEVPLSGGVARRATTRRSVLRGAAALGLGALGTVSGARAQAPAGSSKPGTAVGGAPEAAAARPFTPRDPFIEPVRSGNKRFEITAQNATVAIAYGVSFAGWTFNGMIPGPFFRAVKGDTITASIHNAAPLDHSVDFHAARVATDHGYQVIKPGDSFEWSYQAQYPGAFLYHCGTMPTLMHIGSGLYGTVIVDPKEGWAPAQELVFVRSDFYLKDGLGGAQVVDSDKLFGLGLPDYVLFNGYANQYVDHPITITVGKLVRIFFVNAGPNIWSSFHIVGTIFDTVYFNANPKNAMYGMQSISIGPGDGACVEMRFDEPGTYVAVNHSFGHASHGAQAKIRAE